MEGQLTQDSRNDPHAYEVLSLKRELVRLAEANAELDWDIPREYEQLCMNLARIDEIELELAHLGQARSIEVFPTIRSKRHLRLVWSA